MYKASYAGGETWYEYIKMGVRDFRELRINGDGTHSVILTTDSLKTVRDITRTDNQLYATEGGKNKLAHSMDGANYLTKQDFNKYIEQPELDWLRQG